LEPTHRLCRASTGSDSSLTNWSTSCSSVVGDHLRALIPGHRTRPMPMRPRPLSPSVIAGHPSLGGRQSASRGRGPDPPPRYRR
jgi:hypothetical protein